MTKCSFSPMVESHQKTRYPFGMSSNSRSVVIRDATKADAASLAYFMSALMSERLDTVSQRPPPTADEERDFVAAAANAGAAILIAVEDTKIVGLLDLWPGQKSHDRHVCRFGMSVARARRGQGIGRQLVVAAIERCRSWPLSCRLELEVTPWNAPAISLYKKLGFIVEATKRKAINLRGQPEDLILMALTW
jgi:putative acetyltransferase